MKLQLTKLLKKIVSFHLGTGDFLMALAKTSLQVC